MNQDEATQALVAARKLDALYNAYRATSRANAMVARRIEATYKAREGIDEAERTLALQRLAARIALSRENDLVFADRSAQMRRRIDELEEWEP